jgi:hypothetical protein
MAKGFKQGAGGVSPLNFKVVGNPQPTNPKENTIWVDTDVKITGYQFSAGYQGKNLLKNTATSQTINGVTFTVNEDGSVTVNGTATAISDFYFWGSTTDSGSYLYIPKGSRVVGSDESSLRWIAREKTAGAVIAMSAINSLLAERDCYFYGIFIRASQDMTNNGRVVYPMIRPAGTDDTYEPYGYAQEGFVWIKTGTSSTAAFNALKKNGIQVYPISANQYTGGAWVAKPTKIRKNSAWVDFRTYMMQGGADKSDITGGWIAKGLKYGDWNGQIAGNVSITKNSGYQTFSVAKNTASAASGIVYAKNKIDLSGISKITVRASGSGGDGRSLSIWSNIGTTHTENRVAYADISTLQNYSLNVSNLSGSYFIGFSLRNSIGNACSVNVYDIYYE